MGTNGKIGKERGYQVNDTRDHKYINYNFD